MEKRRTRLWLLVLGAFASIAVPVMLLIGLDVRDDRPLDQPQTYPFWNIASVSGLELGEWPLPDGAAIPVARGLVLVPLRALGQSVDFDADPRMYLRLGPRDIAVGEFLAVSRRCEVVLASVPVDLAPFPFASAARAKGTQTARLLYTPSLGGSFRTIFEHGYVCEPRGIRQSSCIISTGGYTDGVAMLNDEGELTAMLMQRGDGGYRMSGPNVDCIRAFLKETRHDHKTLVR